MTEFEALLERYNYPLAPEMIATSPIDPRDSSRLLVYKRENHHIAEDIFCDLVKYIPKGALLVFNDTKVIPARLPAFLTTGAKVELLCTKFDSHEIRALCERYLPVGERLRVSDQVSLIVLVKHDSEYFLTLEGAVDIKPLLKELGTTPLPPYLKHSPLTENERRDKYQTIFAREDGSIAAPTASLHFTENVFNSLTNASIEKTFLTLHVNLGTFMPLSRTSVEIGELHEEQFEISEESMQKIQNAKLQKRPIIAVGTTALRAVESAFAGKKGSTRLFIQEGYKFQAVTGLITNFHVPKSSLMMLVAALTGRERLLQLYEYASRERFRFLSFGDAMMIL